MGEVRACKRKKQNEAFSVMDDGSDDSDRLFRSNVQSGRLGLDRNMAGQSGRTATDGETGSPDITPEEHGKGHGSVPVAHLSRGSQVRLRFSNEYGDMPFTLTAVTVGLASESLNAAPGSLKKVTFGGKEAITVPAGAPVLSDAIALEVGDFADLVVSVYLNDGTTVFDCGSDAAPSDQAVIGGSDATLAERLSAGKCLFTLRPLISEIDVFAYSPHKR